MNRYMYTEIKCLKKLDNRKEFFQRGYTLVEALVASAILLGALIPAILFFGKITVNQRAKDLIIASQLAEEKIEKTITFNQYNNDEKRLNLNNVTWRILQKIKNRSGLIEIRVRVFKKNQLTPLVELKTLRILK